MSIAQQARSAEVVRRMRPNMPTLTEHGDISGYCDTCQTAYRIGLELFYKIAENIDKKAITQHNVDIKIRHKQWPGEHEPNTFLTHIKDKKVIEHRYELFSHRLDDYLVHCGVQLYLPMEPHDPHCRFVTMEVDMPIRKQAPYTIREYANTALHDIIRLAQNTYPKGISVIDQRELLHVIETKIKIIIGTPWGQIPREPGWVRKETHYHGEKPANVPDQEATVTEQQLRPRSEIDGSVSEPTYFELQAMEIDSTEAAQPPDRSNLGTMTTEAAAVQITTDSGSAATAREIYQPRPRRMTIPMTVRPRTPRIETSEEPLLHRRPENPRNSIQQMREATQSRLPVRHRVLQVRQDAQREAEEARY